MCNKAVDDSLAMLKSFSTSLSQVEWLKIFIQPVYNDHLGDEISVVIIDRWSL